MEAAAIQPQDTTCGFFINRQRFFSHCQTWFKHRGDTWLLMFLSCLVSANWWTLTSTYPHLNLHQSRTRWRLQMWLFLFDIRPHLSLTSTMSCESKHNNNTRHQKSNKNTFVVWQLNAFNNVNRKHFALRFLQNIPVIYQYPSIKVECQRVGGTFLWPSRADL